MYKKNTLSLIAVLLTVLSCGIPTFEILNSPTVLAGDTVTVGLTAPVDASNIIGYELYYKIYNSSDTTSIQSDKDALDPTSSDYDNEFGNEKLTKLNFHRLLYGTLELDDSPGYPLISEASLDASQSLKIQFITGEGEIIVNNVSIGIPLRNVKDENDEYYLPFTSIDGESDANGVTSSVSEYSISFAAYSYPNSIILEHESSLPVYLGTITRTNN